MSNGRDDSKSLHEKIGFMRADIKNVGQKVDSVANKVETLTTQLGQVSSSTVPRGECLNRTKIITDKIDALRSDLAKKQTKQDHPAVLTNTTNPHIVVPQELASSNDRPRKRSFVRRLRDNLALVLTICSLISVLIVGLVKLSHFVVTFEKSLKMAQESTQRQTYELKEELKEIKDRKEVIYVPIATDAGAEKEERPRRRRRRPR